MSFYSLEHKLQTSKMTKLFKTAFIYFFGAFLFVISTPTSSIPAILLNKTIKTILHAPITSSLCTLLVLLPLSGALPHFGPFVRTSS